jgi:mono/diheme cytochrome c family protein
MATGTHPMLIDGRIIKLIISFVLFGVMPVTLADEAQIAEGQELYTEFCESCHGKNKSGLSEFNGDLAVLTDRLEGNTEEMPDFAGFFEEDEITAMYAYLSAPAVAGE